MHLKPLPSLIQLPCCPATFIKRKKEAVEFSERHPDDQLLYVFPFCVPPRGKPTHSKAYM